MVLEIILQNIALAKKLNRPLCQDTGSLTFFVKSDSKNWEKIKKAIFTATKKATKTGLLRPNSVDPVSGKNLGNIPEIEFEIAKNLKTEISLLLKGGGSENVSTQISLPLETKFGLATRDFNGVEKAVIEILESSVGKGCPPGIASIVIGGDRAEAFKLAKKNLLKKIGSQNSNSKLQKLSDKILQKINLTKIGPGGLGGRTTLLDCRIDSLPRHPASFFLTLAYSCWAMRWGKIVLSSSGKILKNNFSKKVLLDNFEIKKAKKIQLPVSEKEIRKLRAGEVIAISGRIFTARDRVHDFVMRKNLPKNLEKLAVFHAGPIVIQKNKKWKIVAVGPTTSARLDIFTPEFLSKTGTKIIIGKSGMGEVTQKALQKFGAIYVHAIGGAAAFYADSIREVCGVDFLEEFGMPDAMWELEVENLLAIVGMDSFGGKI